MPIITKYICDRCKKEHDTAENIWDIAITCENSRYRSSYTTPTKHQSAIWCRTCVNEMGIFTPLLRAEGDFPPPITIDDMIRAIIVETIQNQE